MQRYRTELKIVKGVLSTIFLVLESIFNMFRWLFRRFILKKRQNTDGYIYTESDKKIIYEHREIAEEILGRKLTKYEVVHHINGKTSDNSPANLCIMDSIEHDRYHKWCDFIYKTYKRYPRRDTQLRKLKENFKGILLSEVSQKVSGD